MISSGHTVTLTEASNLSAEVYKRFEIQNEEHYKNVPDNIRTFWMELPSKILERIAVSTIPKRDEQMLMVRIGVVMENTDFNHYKLILNILK